MVGALAVGVLLLSGLGVRGWFVYTRKHKVEGQLVTQPISKARLQVAITDLGTLEPADNTYITCKVKAKSPGQPSTSIRWVIDNGSLVKEGDKILELDDSALQDQLQAQQVLVYNAEDAWKQAELKREVDLVTNSTQVESFRNKRKVAEIALQEYLEGQYVTSKVDLENKRIMALSDLTMWQERAAWSYRMSQPGRQYVTTSQAEADEARHLTARLTKESILKQIEVLDNLTKRKNVDDLTGQITENKLQMKLYEKKLEKELEADEASVRSKYAVYEKELSRLHDIEKEIANCFVRAPRDGMVVYYVEERARWGASGGVIAQGEQVKEGQKLLAVPDLTRLVVNARVHEAMVPRVRDDRMTETGFSEAVNTALLFTPNPLGALSAYVTFDTDMQTTFSNNNSHLERMRTERGMDAIVKVSAFQDRPLKGHVKSVAPVASQTDFFNSDVKVYQTYIAIDDDRLQGLKPGMYANVTILVDTTPEPVLQIPLQALLGSVDMGNKRRCFVMVDNQPQMREISLGIANETMAEVKEGLQEGDVVVLNPGVLLSDKEKVDYGVSASNSRGEGGGKGGWKGKGGQGKGGPGMKGGKGGPGGGSPGGPGGAGGAPGGGRPGSGARSQGGSGGGGKAAANP